MDVAVIEPGQDFREAIDKSVASCSVLLAVIGQHWLEARDASGRRRLDDPGDFVRIELASALRANIPIVPVLVRGSRMPRSEELPDDLKDLAYRNAVELTHARWRSDIPLLIRALRPYMGTPVVENRGPEASSAGAAAGQRISDPRVDGGTTGSAIDAQTVDRLSRELAGYLGPIANMIVRRAAQRTASFDDLCATIAREIGSDADRARFLRSCRE